MLLLIGVLLCCFHLKAALPFVWSPDSVSIIKAAEKSELFYDSLQQKAHRHRFTGWMYDMLVCSPKEECDLNFLSYEYYHQFDGKTIASVRILPLDVFGPTFDDTTRVARLRIERFANHVHTKSNIRAIRRNLWIKEGMVFDANLVMDNERVLRELPYLKDVRISVTPRVGNENMVDMLVMTKDVFAFGVTGRIDEIDSGEFGIYHQNIFGVGHQVSAKFVGHLNQEPYLGIETFYSIKNFGGDFVDIQTGYFDTYKRHGFLINFSKEFLRPQSVWAGGFYFGRFFRVNQIPVDPVKTDFSLNLGLLDVWYGRNLRLCKNESDSRFQMTLSGRVRHLDFIKRPEADAENNQYFANSTFYLGSLSFSQRKYVRDRLIYSYGIVEDIPKGYLHEFVLGYDNNEFNRRWYSHTYLSSGNIVRYKPYYLFASLGVGGFFNQKRFEQGLLEVNVNYISRLFNAGGLNARQFLKVNYMTGIRRFDIENVSLRYRNGIRGFTSSDAVGKQRLSMNLETVVFQRREFLKFNTALFSFLDLGLIGSNHKVIFTQDYYAGVGFGIRLRNENLVFKTIQIRLAYYPNSPKDMGSVGFILEEQLKTRFYSFQPKAPEPLVFD